MSPNLLVTGAAGYIGGSFLDRLISAEGPFKDLHISAAVRSREQVKALSKLGANVVQLDLSDEAAVLRTVLSNEIDIIVHTACSFKPDLVAHLINALGQRRKDSGAEVHFIQTSVTTTFSQQAGWPYGVVKDSDAIFCMQKELGPEHPVRETDMLTVELSKARGVSSYIVQVPTVYGRGTGQWRKLSVGLPAYIKTFMARRTVYKFDTDGTPDTVHIHDLVTLYAHLLRDILTHTPLPSNERGHYSAKSHATSWYAIMARLGSVLYARGLVDDAEPKTWGSDEEAAGALGFPRAFVRAMCTYSGQLEPDNSRKLGWKPEWDKARFLREMDQEVRDVLEVDDVRATIFDELLAKE